MKSTDIIEEFEDSARRTLTAKLTAIGLHALSGRALVWMAFVGAAGLWTMAMIEPQWIKIAVASGYCLMVLVPVLVRDTKGE